MKKNILLAGLEEHFSKQELALLNEARVGIAGAGGLGSNTAIILARCGIQKMIIADQDRVEASNLNRQHYWPRHIGQKKVDALAEILLELNPEMEIEMIETPLTQNNLAPILITCPIWVEALDSAQTKCMFVREALEYADFVASANGLCGYGGESLTHKKMGKLHIVGDFKSSSDNLAPLAPRVTQAAAMMADSVIEYILKKD